MRWPGREDLLAEGLKSYAITADDWRYRWRGKWIHVACRDFTFRVPGPVTDMETPLRP